MNHSLIDIERSYLFLEPPKIESWKAKLIFARKGGPVGVCLDFSAYSGGIGPNYWNPRTRLMLRNAVDFTEGEEVSIDLMELDNNPRFWRWSTPIDRNERPLVSLTTHHCRLAFVAESGPLDYFNFLVILDEGKRTPSLIGENNFVYAQKWRDEDAPDRIPGMARLVPSHSVSRKVFVTRDGM